MDSQQVREEPFPAKTRQAKGDISGTPAEATSMFFSDKIMITVSQEGRLSQWIQVPLSSSSGAMVDLNLPSSTSAMTPSSHLTPSTLFGGGGEARETIGQLYASQIASFINKRDPDDRRTVVLGLGLLNVEKDMPRGTYFDFLELVQKVL